MFGAPAEKLLVCTIPFFLLLTPKQQLFEKRRNGGPLERKEVISRLSRAWWFDHRMAYHRRHLSREEEDAVRDGFHRLAQIDSYSRLPALTERAFEDDFLLEVAPQLSRRLASALWRAIAAESWSIPEERFVCALAIARHGTEREKMKLALKVAGRLTANRESLDRWSQPNPTSRSVVALLRAIREDTLVAGSLSTSASGSAAVSRAASSSAESTTVTTGVAAASDDEDEDDDDNSLYSRGGFSQRSTNPSPVRSSSELADLLGAYNFNEEVTAADFGCSIYDEEEEDEEEEKSSGAATSEGGFVVVGGGEDDDDYRNRNGSAYVKRGASQRRRLGGAAGGVTMKHDEEAERVLAVIRNELCNFVSTALGSWSLPPPSSDDQSSTSTSRYTSLADQLEPAARRRRRSPPDQQHPLANLRASTPEVGLPDTPMALRIAFARGGDHVYATAATSSLSDINIANNKETASLVPHPPSPIRDDDDDDDRMDDASEDDEVVHANSGVLPRDSPPPHLLEQHLSSSTKEEEEEDEDEPARQRVRRTTEDEEEGDEYDRRRAPKQRRHDVTNLYSSYHYPREDDALVATLFVAMQDRSQSNSVDVNAVVETFSRPKQDRRLFAVAMSPFATAPAIPPPQEEDLAATSKSSDEKSGKSADPLEEPMAKTGTAWLPRSASRRLFFDALDRNGSGVAHFEEFARVMRCACGMYSEASAAEERQICLGVLGVEPGSLRACVEDALYVRLRVARPADPTTERRVASRYLSSPDHFYDSNRTVLKPGDEFRVLPYPWFRYWIEWTAEPGESAQKYYQQHSDAIRRPPPIDVSHLVRDTCIASQRVLKAFESAVSSAVIVPMTSCTTQKDVVISSAVNDDVDDDCRGAGIRTDDDEEEEAEVPLMDSRGMALKENAVHRQDFELVSVVLYEALVAWHTTRGAAISRIVPPAAASEDSAAPKTLDLHPPRLFAQAKKGGLLVVPCWKHETVEDVAKRAFHGFAQRNEDRLGNSPPRGPVTRRRRRRGWSRQGLPPVTTASSARDRLKIHLLRTVRPRRVVPPAHDQQPADVRPEDQMCVEKLALVYDGPPFPRTAYASRSSLFSSREPLTASVWTSTIGDLVQRQLSGEDDLLPRDISFELLFEDEDDDEPDMYAKTSSEPEQHPIATAANSTDPPPAVAPSANNVVNPFKGEVGLRNLGNTCYMNAVIQALAHVPPLREYFTSGEFAYDINQCSKFGAKGTLAASFGQLLHQLSSSDSEAVTPDAFKRTLSQWDNMFAGYQQQDASEFLIKLFDGLGEDLNRITNKPYLENPDVNSDGTSDDKGEGSRDDRDNGGSDKFDEDDARTSAESRERRVANECWRNHAKLREDHPITALFGGQCRREIYCNKNERERSVGFDAFSSLTVPLYDTETTNANSSEELVDVRVTIRFARNRIWPLEVVARVSLDASVGDVLAECAKIRLESDAILNSPDLADDVAPLRQENLVAMLPIMVPSPTSNDKALEATSRLLMPSVRIRESPITIVYVATGPQRLEVYETFPEFPTTSVEAIDAEASRSSYVCVALRTLVDVDAYFLESSRLSFFGDPFVVRIIAGVTTGSMLRRQIWEHVRPWMTSVPEDDSRDKPHPIFDVRLFPPRGSDRDRSASSTLASSEMLLPGGGRLIPNTDAILVHRATDFDHHQLVVDVPRSARVRFNERCMAFSMIHETCAPPPPKPPIALAACVKSYCAPEIVTKYSKSETKKNGGEYTEAEHTKTLSISRPPPFLALVLKRFMVTERGRKRKLSERVAFPIQGLDLSEFCRERRPRAKQPKRDDDSGSTTADDDDDAGDVGAPIYDLVSVVNHFGGLEHGHYTCAARRLDNSGWLEFDDKRVDKLDLGETCDDPAAYVLVYARRDTIKAAPTPLEYLRRRFARVHNEKVDVEALLRPPQSVIISPTAGAVHSMTTMTAPDRPNPPLLTAGPRQRDDDGSADLPAATARHLLVVGPPASPPPPPPPYHQHSPTNVAASRVVSHSTADQDFHDSRGSNLMGGLVNGTVISATSSSGPPSPTVSVANRQSGASSSFRQRQPFVEDNGIRPIQPPPQRREVARRDEDDENRHPTEGDVEDRRRIQPIGMPERPSYGFDQVFHASRQNDGRNVVRTISRVEEDDEDFHSTRPGVVGDANMASNDDLDRF